MSLSKLDSVFFIGIGGIGMSALARYYNSLGTKVFGYDKTETAITRALQNEGILVAFDDDPAWLREVLEKINKENFMVVYTPAIPTKSLLMQYVIDQQYKLLKRSEVLGLITKSTLNLSIAGTHGKTTTSCLLSHILTTANIPHVAFLGGIATNYNSNYWNSLKPGSEAISITEADEFDRSFLTLRPMYAGITNMDADHLDIYEKKENLTKSFIDFGNLVDGKGKLYVQSDCQNFFDKTIITYGVETGHISARNVHIHNDRFVFDLYVDNDVYRLLNLGIPGKHNIENAVVASAIAIDLGVSESVLRLALASFTGVKRRFEYIIRNENQIYIDDYAHHPTELNAIISSVQQLYPGELITGIFQPHLFSRTRDFMDDFAASLSQLDEVILMDIYPAREVPIAGVSSQKLLEKINTTKSLLNRDDIVNKIVTDKPKVLLTLGAGDIDALVSPLKLALTYE